MRHLFIINPISGSNAARSRLLQSLQTYQKEHPNLIEIAYVHSADNFRKCIQEAAVDPSPLRLYVCGGDGTINQAAQLIVGQHHIELAAVPLGTGNDFLRNFQNTGGFFDIDALVNGYSIPIDLIRINDEYAINIINTGFDCQVVATVERLRKQLRYFRVFAYTIGVLVNLIQKPTVTLRITTEDGEHLDGEFLLALFANGSYYGGGYHSAPMARIDDGIIDMVSIKPISRLKFISLLSSYKKGRIFENRRAIGYIEHHRARRVKISSEIPFNICLDGEIRTLQQAELEMLPGAIRFVLPSSISYT